MLVAVVRGCFSRAVINAERPWWELVLDARLRLLEVIWKHIDHVTFQLQSGARNWIRISVSHVVNVSAHVASKINV